MKKYITILSLFFISFFSAQQSEICKCESLKKSEDSIKKYSYYSFKPISKKKAVKSPYNFISIKYLDNYSDSKKIIDSLEMKLNNFFEHNKIENEYLKYKTEDSIKKIESSKTIGNIPMSLIIKSGKFNNSIAVLYQTEDYLKSKYYIALSNDSGKTWKNFYTGLIKHFNFVFKSNSQFPLWKDKNHLQIEADIVRMIDPMSFPGPSEKYESLKNNALVSIKLDEIIKDSDEDGFNDLEEKFYLFTNPLSKDTDEDGIPDFEDTNPRYKNTDNDFTKLLQGILYGDYPVLEGSDIRETEFIINLKTFERDFKNPALYFTETKKGFSKSFDFNVIITDNKSLKHMAPVGQKIIVLTSKEFSIYKKINFMNIYTPRYSKLFKCDELSDTYIFTVDNIWLGRTYLIKRIPEGWLIKTISSWQT